MCSIVGCIGVKHSREVVLSGLSRLEYRGYDSAGFACYDEDRKQVLTIRAVGGVADLRLAMQERSYDAQGLIGIGHTRWSTHGAVTEYNAHPVSDCTQRVFIVQNGTLENDAVLRAELAASGHRFSSQTDSELIAHCYEAALQVITEQGKKISRGQLSQMMQNVLHRLQGTYAFILLLEDIPDTLLIARQRLPLCIGFGENVAYVASDILACAGLVERVLFLPDRTYAIVQKDNVQLFAWDGSELAVSIERIAVSWDESGMRGHPHYMLKEIYEQSDVIRTLAYYGPTDVSDLVGRNISLIDETVIRMVGCGASAHAAYLAQPFFENLVSIPSNVFIATDMRERPLFEQAGSWALVLSQSGETADVLESVRLMKERGMCILGITNVVTSALAREADDTLLMRAGVEVAVASTKSVVAHIALLYLLAHEIAYRRHKITHMVKDQAAHNLAQLADVIAQHLVLQKDALLRIAHSLALLPHMFVIGRAVGYAVAREIALKLKEIAYIFAEACPAGELKHGPLALIDADMYVIVCSSIDETAYRKLIINVQQIKSRHGKIVSLVYEGQHELQVLSDDYVIVPVPQDPLLAHVVMISMAQYMIYHTAALLGRSIDKPRNLAKSVTVE